MNENQQVYQVYFDRDRGYVVMNWNGYATSSQFKEGTEAMLKLLIDNQVGKVLANTRNMDIIGMEDQRWVESVFLPRAVKYGFRAIALVKPVSYFNAVAIESISYKAGQENLQIRIFDNADEAGDWLAALVI